MKVSCLIVLCLSAALAALVPAPARAQQTGIIQQIVFTSNTPDGRPPVPAATLLGLMQTKVGQPFDPAAVRRDIDHLNNPQTGYLRQQGFFPYVNRYHPGMSFDFTGGVLTIRLYESLIAEIAITGNRKIRTEDILRKMQSKAAGLLNENTLQADMERLKKTGDFQSVGPPRVDTSDRQIEITVPVVERPDLTVAGDAAQRPQAGEVWMEGSIRDLDAAQKRLVLLVVRTQAPGQPAQDADALRAQAVVVGPVTRLHPPIGGALALSAFQPGDTVIVVGRRPAPGQPLTARLIASP